MANGTIQITLNIDGSDLVRIAALLVMLFG